MAKKIQVTSTAAKAGAREAGLDSAAGFFREVDEMIQEERLRGLWQTWRWAIIAGVSALVIGTAAFQGWEALARHKAQAVAEQWYSLSKMKPSDAVYNEKLDAMRASGASGYRALAMFAEAEDLEKVDNAENRRKAAALYAQVAADGSLPGWLRDLAELNTAMVIMGVDDGVARTHLEKLASKDGSAVQAPALELLAVDVLATGDAPKARVLTEKLLGMQDIPPDMRERALKRLGSFTTLGN